MAQPTYSVGISYVEHDAGVCLGGGSYPTAAQALDAALNAARRHEDAQELTVSIWLGTRRLWTFEPCEDAEGDCIARAPEWAAHINPLQEAA